VHDDLLDAALQSCLKSAGEIHSVAERRRAVSTTYYALYHFIARVVVSELLGPFASNLHRASTQVYRSMAHRDLKRACDIATRPDSGFPLPIVVFAKATREAYALRLTADYALDVDDQSFSVDLVLNGIEDAERAITAFQSADPKHRRAFVILVAVRPGIASS
jgi:uncharacterized protein (UPF0332 family)